MQQKRFRFGILTSPMTALTFTEVNSLFGHFHCSKRSICVVPIFWPSSRWITDLDVRSDR
jgi:hypothetical protein